MNTTTLIISLITGWTVLSVVLAGTWSRFAKHRTKREQAIIQSMAAHPAGRGRRG